MKKMILNKLCKKELSEKLQGTKLNKIEQLIFLILTKLKNQENFQKITHIIILLL